MPRKNIISDIGFEPMRTIRWVHSYLKEKQKFKQVRTTNLVFWGELIDKYKDINANLKTVFTDYAMLKLVLYSPHMFLLFCQSKVGVVKKFWGEVFHITMIK